MGTQGVKNFENTLQLIEEKNYEAAKKEALNSKWAQQTPERANSVVKNFTESKSKPNKPYVATEKDKIDNLLFESYNKLRQDGLHEKNISFDSWKEVQLELKPTIFSSLENAENYKNEVFKATLKKDLKGNYILNKNEISERGQPKDRSDISLPTAAPKQFKKLSSVTPLQAALNLRTKTQPTQNISIKNIPNKVDTIITAKDLPTKESQAIKTIANTEPSIIESVKNTIVKTTEESKILAKNITEWAERFAVKQGVLNPDKVETEKVYEVHTPNVHTYTPPSQRQKERDNITSKKYEKIGVTSNGHLMYAYTFDLRQGNDYVPIKNVGNSKLTDKYENVEGIAHFILDADLTSGYQHEYTKNYVNQQLKSKKPIASPGSSVEEAYVPVVEKRNNLVNVTYKPQSQVTKNDNVPSILRQYRFTDLEWDKPGKTSPGGNFKETVSGLLTKDGNETTLIYPTADKNKESYGKFGGASVVFIIPEKNIAIDFAGSIKQIKQMGEKLSQQYRINLNNLIIGYHDIGSFSAKPAANSKGELKFSQWSGFNPEPFTGGALAIPKQN